MTVDQLRYAQALRERAALASRVRHLENELADTRAYLARVDDDIADHERDLGVPA